MTKTSNIITTVNGRTIEVTIPEALGLPRIPWAAIEAAGVDLTDILDEAVAHGDEVLARRARRAIASR